MRKLLLIFLLLSPPGVKKLVLRWFFGARIGRGVRVGWFALVTGRRVEIGDYSEIRSFSQVRCGEVHVGAYSVIGNSVHIYGPGVFRMGRHSMVGSETQINVWHDVQIGDLSALGSRCMVVTHGVWLPYTEGYWVKFAGVTIGDRAWIASGVFIQPGIRIGNEVFVNAMSVVKKDVPDGAVVEGYPAHQVARMEELKRTMTPQRLNAAVETMLRHFADLELQRERGVTAQSDGPGRLSFRCRGRDYLVAHVSGDGPPPDPRDWQGGKRVILLVSRPNWDAPRGLRNVMLISLTTMRTRRPRDPIHGALERFLRGYYGLKLEYQG